jgi:hypothetical protein
MRLLCVTTCAIAFAIASAACSGGETAVLGFPGGDQDPTEPATGGDDGAKPPPPKPAPADAGVEASGPPAPPPNAFTGAPAYTSKLGPSTRKTAHPFPNDDPRGRPCLNCHGGSATSFAFAGTVYTTAAGTTPAARVEVRARDKNGKALSAWTNADGNFFFLLEPDGDLVFPGHAGIRTATATKLMSGGALNGNCNFCHTAGDAGRLVAP